MRNKYSIKPTIRKDKLREDGKMPIVLQIIVNGKAYKRATGEYIFEKDWDNDNSLVKRSVFRSGIINNRIKHEINDLEEYLNKLETHKEILSLEDVRAFYSKEKKIHLYDFWEEQMELWKNKLRPTTIKNYTCTLNRLKEFSPNPLLSGVDYRFISRFDAYLKSERNNETSGANTRHKCLKVILKEAKRHNIIQSIPYENFKLKKSEGRKVYLTSKELDKLIKYNVPFEMVHLQEVKDMFLFSCYTGLRISDVTNLKWENIVGDKIRITMIKTEHDFVTALIKPSKEIVNKYRGRGTPFVFPKRSHQKINKNLKTLMKDAKINKDVSMHCGRHTFASSLLERKVDIHTIMNLLGHKNITVTMTYLHSLDESKLESLKVLEKDSALKSFS